MMEIERRIVVVGNTGSGKSTLAKQLAGYFGIPYIEQDSLFWNENWTETPEETFRQKVKEAIQQAGNQWVIDGNYGLSRDIVWSQADMLIWLDYPLSIIFWRLFWRTLKRTLSKVELWNGNRERFWKQFLSRDSLFWWAWTSHQKRKQTYNEIIAENQFPNLQILHFRYPNETEKWLRQLQAASSAN
jgi:adenylate kinase family enzyme